MRTGDGGFGNGELQTYTTENVRVNADNLEITARRDEDGVTLTSARVDTAGKVELQYGTIMARIKNPDVDAYVNSLLLLLLLTHYFV